MSPALDIFACTVCHADVPDPGAAPWSCGQCGADYPSGEVPVLIPLGDIDWAKEAHVHRRAANEEYRSRLEKNDVWWVDSSEYRALLNRHDWRSYRSPILDYVARRYRGPVVVDAGGGDGWFLKRAMERVPGMRGVLLDLSDVIVHSGMQRNRLEAGTGVSASLEHLPLRPDSVDVVVSIEVMEHVHNPAEVFASVWRALKPGGSFILTTPNPASYALWFEEGKFPGLWAGIRSAVRGRVPEQQSEVRMVRGVLERYLTPRELVDMGRAAGFGRVKHRSVGIGLAPMPYYLAEYRRWPLWALGHYSRVAIPLERWLVCPPWLPWGKVQRVTCIK